MVPLVLMKRDLRSHLSRLFLVCGKKSIDWLVIAELLYLSRF